MAGGTGPRVTVAVIGLGEMGAIHAQNLARNPGVRLALASTRKERLVTLGAELMVDSEMQFNSYESAMKSTEVDGLVISTSPASHVGLVEKGLEHGKHVFIEKPLCLGGADVRGLAERTGYAKGGEISKRVIVGYMRRWDDEYWRVWNKVRAGEIGKVLLVKGTTGDADYPEKYWRDGGKDMLLRDLASHDIDMARWLFGEEVKKVYVAGRRMVYPGLEKIGDLDTAVAVLEMEGGGLSILHWSRCLNYGYNVTGEVVGAEGSVRVGRVEWEGVELLKGGHTSRNIMLNYPVRCKQAFANEMDGFVDLLRAKGTDANWMKKVEQNEPRYATFDDGLRAGLVADALVESMHSGLPVHVDYSKITCGTIS